MQKNKPVIMLELDASHYSFVLLVIALFVIAFVIYPNPALAMWFGFGVAGYSVIANDSIQTLGTFFSSNRQIPWYWQWMLIGGIMLLVMVYGYIVHHGDVSFGRLQTIPQPQSYNFLQLMSPVILVVLTYWRMPVSTTFLLLSVFGSKRTIEQMLLKSLLGYGLALLGSIAVFYIIHTLLKKRFNGVEYPVKVWRFLQICITMGLWTIWLMHDIANVAVFLPRQLDGAQFAIVASYLFAVVGVMMYLGGGRIQRVVTEKTQVADYRAATLIDLVYAVILVLLKEWSSIPISTTWVFLGVLAGREIAIYWVGRSPWSKRQLNQLVLRDIVLAGSGLVISLIIALIS